MGWNTVGLMSIHSETGARTMAQHREMKRIQAENRNAETPPERTARYRMDPVFRGQVQAEQAYAALKAKLEQQAA